ncbi:Chaperone protein HscA like protein [Micromonospora saelicesensis]|uniref:Chaperone protein HscA like protein n=1 Tax=Micromonospora saelicesensis TaxID=285676 RepID=A0A328NXI6_9ACTN|nr:Hsp70 family protein [Micromonospora saelicesensis]RAO39171.1 Chaperone protein HscA like protein [Micromonospora saelicesensis]
MAGQHEGFALGIDLGMSNTVAVLRWPDGRTRPLLMDGQPLSPSAVYADPDGTLHSGWDARRLAQADPARFEANPKRRVDEPTVQLGDRAYPPADLLAAVLAAVGRAAVGAVGFLPPAVVTCPAAWDATRRQVLADALLRAGWPQAVEHTLAGPTPPGTRLLREPVAAARYYTQVLHRPVPVGGAIAVFDFGGGTLDVAVLRNEGADPWGDSGFSVVADGGLPDLGGLDLDAALVRRVGELVGERHAAQWARLTRPADPAQRRDQVRLWDEVRGAKETLSRSATAPVAVPGVAETIQLTRADVERVATPLLRRAVQRAREVIAAAGLRPDQLDGLFLVGGSSRIPLVARMLHAELGIAPTVLDQPELPVAEGALTDLPLRKALPAPAYAGAPLAPPAPAPVSPPAPAGAPAPVVPSQPWPGSTPPAGPPPGPGLAGVTPTPPDGATRWRRARWVVLGAVLALAGVATAATLYLTRDRYPDLKFDSLRELSRPSAGAARPADMWTAVLDDRAYLAFPLPDDRLEVVAVDASTGDQLWRKQTDVRADDWEAIIAVPGGVAVLADAPGDSTPRPFAVLDGRNGEQRWQRVLRGDDDVYFADDTAVLVDRAADELVGLRLTNGSAKWRQPNPRGQYAGGRTVVRPVGTDAAAGGPAFLDGTPRNPWTSKKRRLVQVGADRSVRLIDMASGAVLRQWGSVADLDDLVVAHEDRLYVAANEGGYQLLAYDLGSDAEPVVLHRSGNDEYRPKELIACGERRACLLQVPNNDVARTEVVAATEGERMISWSAPGVTGLVALGEQVLAQREFPEPIVTVFDAAGKPVLRDRGGVAVRLDAGNLLVFAKAPSVVADNRVLAGVWAESGEVDELGELKDVRSSSCSWNTHVIACGADKDFVLYRFTDD